MEDVAIGRAPLPRFLALLAPERARVFERQIGDAVALLHGRTVWNISSTARGGGVAEMLQTLLAYTRAAGVETRWLVTDGDPAFFTITKRLHNVLHGQPGDGGPLGDAERDRYQRVQDRNARQAQEIVRPGDIVLLHDPQTAGMAAALRAVGAHVVWRCHIGRDTGNDLTEVGWSFLRPFVEPAEAFVFSRKEYVPGWVPPDRLWVVPPSLDPFSAKNADVSPADVAATLRRVHLVDLPRDHGSTSFVRRDGTSGRVRPRTGMVLDGPAVPAAARVVLQVSRWDRLKDMQGVMRGFAEHLGLLDDDVHLMLVGPDVSSVTDDPEGAEVLDECLAGWHELPPQVRARVHLCGLPMDDVDENAHIVNALQRHAAVVVQKSLVEGFGLTVTEPMWKGRPVVASAVGGIRDQIVDGTSGLLVEDPADLEGFTRCVARVLDDEAMATALGAGAHERVRDRFLADRHLGQYGEAFDRLING